MTTANKSMRPDRQIHPAILKAVLVLQAICAASVILRLIRTAAGQPVAIAADDSRIQTGATVLLPVLNEEEQLEDCLDSIAGAPGVGSTVVIDTGSSDRTVEIAERLACRHESIRVVEAGPSPPDWNGKIWGLERGLRWVSEETEWILTIDADVTVDRALVRSLLVKAASENLDLLSIATQQRVEGFALSMLHPSMLTTLVYRFGIPGHVATSVRDVQANGQCFLVRRQALLDCGGFEEFRSSICEDVTIARCFVESGYRVGFHEGGALVSTEMYRSFGAAWYGWSRSLPTRDRYFGLWGWWRLTEVLIAQGLAVPSMLTLALNSRLRRSRWAIIPLVVALTRLGTLAGTRRAYVTRHWSYWLSPLADLPVAVRIIISATQRVYVWRGQQLIRGE